MNHTMSTLSRLLLVVFLLAAGLAIPYRTAQALPHGEFIVNSNSDADSGVDGVCTLHEAIHAAVTNSNHHECTNTFTTFADYEIAFSIIGSSTTILLGSQLPAITSGTMTIDGWNSGTPIVIDGADHYRPFYVAAPASLTLKNLTVQRGDVIGNGGGAYNLGTLNVFNSSFSSNVATSEGGGIWNSGTLTIANSTFSGNSARYGGGLENNDGTATILNSTFSGNAATENGGALSTWIGAVTTVKNTIMANRAGLTPEDCWNGNGGLTGDHNSIETNGGFPTYNCSAITTSAADPMLGSLTGSPAYFPLLAGSPALDTGDSTVCAASPVSNTSENGIPRPQGAGCEIGAYESQVTLTLKSVGAQDGWVLESSETSSVGGSRDSAATTFLLGDDAANKQYLGLVSFRTGAPLPDDAIITKVTLRIRRQGVTGGGNPVAFLHGFMLDFKRGTFGVPGLQNADFQTPATPGHIYGPFISSPVGGWYGGDLTSADPYINKLATGSGLTQIRLRFEREDNNNAIENYLSLYSGDAGGGQRPQLIIQYYEP